MRKMMNEQLPISKSSPLKARFYDYPYFTYPWHFHTEYEIIYVKEGTGMRFVGNNAEKYADGDILLLGSDLPHYMKSDEVYRQEGSTLRTTGTIIQFEKDFMHHAFNYYPHFMKLKNLLEAVSYTHLRAHETDPCGWLICLNRFRWRQESIRLLLSCNF